MGNGGFEVLEGSLGSSELEFLHQGPSAIPPSSFLGAGTDGGWCLRHPSLHWGALLHWAKGAFFSHCCSSGGEGADKAPRCSTGVGSTNTFILLVKAAAITSSLAKYALLFFPLPSAHSRQGFAPGSLY